MKVGNRSATNWRFAVTSAVLAIATVASSGAEARSRNRDRSESMSRAVPSEQSVRVDEGRLPYTRGKVYGVRLAPGAPFALELPAGETAKNLWYDNRWWAAETTPTGSRVFIRAVGSSDVVGRTGFIHVETEPSDLRISLRVEAVQDTGGASAALEIYVDGSALNDPAQQQMRKAFDRDLIYAQKQAKDRARAQFEAWRKGALANLRGDEVYDRGGDFRITRVVDDRVQTFISIPNATDRAVIQFIDKTGRAELVNYEIENGTYIVQNKVLRPGEKLRLILGKEQGWVALK